MGSFKKQGSGIYQYAQPEAQAELGHIAENQDDRKSSSSGD